VLVLVLELELELELEVGALEVGAIHLSFEGDARRQVTRAVPRCLQPLQGWLTFVGPVPVAARGLATGYFLPALRAESHKSPPVMRITSAQGLVRQLTTDN